MSSTKYKVVLDHLAFRVLEFRESNLDQTVLIANPQAGHGRLDDHDEGQSLAECALNSQEGGVYAIDWKSATHSRMFENEQDLQDQVQLAIAATRSDDIHLVGLCQGGWLSALVATNRPETVQKLTLAGAPIDTSFEGLLSPAGKVPLWQYRTMVMMSGGIVHGDWMLKCWKSPNAAHHAKEEKNPDNVHFYKWYNKTQNLAGAWYIWAIDNIFINNRLPEMLDIKCPVNVVTGNRDDITPPAQTLAIQKNCEQEISTYEVEAGHIGVFMSHKAMDVWPKVFGSA